MDQYSAGHLETIFFAALEIQDLVARAGYIDQACGQDDELRERVAQMLAIQSKVGSFMERPAAALDGTLDLDQKILEAGLCPGFGPGQAVVMGSANHSVLKALSRTLNEMPRVVLRDPKEAGSDPIVRPRSKEIPADHADSRYQLAGEIARGGMGAIIKGRDVDLGRDLAIKVLLESHKDKPEVVQRFIEEAQIGGQLQHPGIVPVYELGQFGDQRPFFSMKLVKGQTLAQLLSARKHPAEDRAKFLGIFEQVCQTMAYAHSRGVIHRDLKPANVMVGAFGEVQVMDWGLAKVLSMGGIADEKKSLEKLTEVSIIRTLRSVGSDAPGSLGSQTQMGSVMGTPAYMSPEQALGEVDRLDERADVFGLGAILCEMLTGKPPYVAASVEQVFRLASRGKLEDCFVRLEVSDVDAELLQIVRDALALEPDDRLPDSGALARRVSEYLQSVDSRLRQAELERHQAVTRSEETRKRQTVVLALAASLLVGVIASTWSAIRASQQRKLAEDSQRAEIVQRKTAEQERGKAQALSDALALEKQELSRQQEVLRETLYASEMNLVQSAMEGKQYGRAAQLLDQQRPAAGQNDLRGFEWHYWQRRLQRGQLRSVEAPSIASNYRWTGTRSFSRHGERLASLVSYPDEVASAAGPRLLAMVDGVSGRELLAPFDPFPDRQDKGDRKQRLLSMSDDGTRVAVGLVNHFSTADDRFGSISIRDGETGSETRRLEIPGVAFEIALTPDGSRLAVECGLPADPRATSGQSGITVWDTSTGELVQTLPMLPRTTLHSRIRWSPNGARLLRQSVSSEKVNETERYRELFQIVDVATGEKIWEREFSALDYPYYAGSWSPDGKLLVIWEGAESGSVAKHDVQLWDSNTGKTLAILDHTETRANLSNLAFSPDGQMLAIVCGLNEIYVWEVPKLALAARESPLHLTTPLLTLSCVKDLLGLAFSADGRELVSLDAGPSIVTWDTTAREDTGIGPDLLELNFAAEISSDASKVAFAVGGQNPVGILWDLVRNEKVFPPIALGLALERPAFSHDGRRVAFAQNASTTQPEAQIVIHDAQTGAVVNTIPIEKSDSSSLIQILALRPDGEQITALLISRSQAQNRRPARLVAWDVVTAKRLFSIPLTSNGSDAPDYSVDGASVILATNDGAEEAVFFDANTGERRRSISLPGAGRAYTINERIQMFYSWSRSQSDAVFWDLATGQERLRMSGYGGGSAVAISPDGSRLVLGKSSYSPNESELTLWNLKSGRRLLALNRPGRINKIAFSPDGNRLVAAFHQLGSISRTPIKPIQIWDATPLPEEQVAK